MSNAQQDPTDPTGVKDLTPRGNSVVTKARDRKALSAYQLRRNGASWDDIAEVLGFPNGDMAQIAAEKAFEKMLRSENKDFMRQLVNDRLDRLLRSVWKKATDEKHPEHLAANDRARLLIADYRKHNGLDEPSEHVITPNMAEMEAWVARVQAIESPPPPEGDIFDLEEVPDAVQA